MPRSTALVFVCCYGQQDTAKSFVRGSAASKWISITNAGRVRRSPQVLGSGQHEYAGQSKQSRGQFQTPTYSIFSSISRLFPVSRLPQDLDMDTVLSVQRIFGPLGVFLPWCNLFKVHNQPQRTLLWIYRYIPPFLYYLKSLLHFLISFRLPLFRLYYLKTTDKFPTFFSLKTLLI